MIASHHHKFSRHLSLRHRGRQSDKVAPAARAQHPQFQPAHVPSFCKTALVERPGVRARISQVSASPYVLAVHPSLPGTLGEFIAHAKANPDKLAYGSSGVASLQQLSAELFSSLTGIKMVHVPYKGKKPHMPHMEKIKTTVRRHHPPSAPSLLLPPSGKFLPSQNRSHNRAS
ncbi:MAG: hypothetical protein EBT30_06810 [Verrucomicrobia bacterium]|nr:hypothetical protein [Verrucomicrobiota bacterium]